MKFKIVCILFFVAIINQAWAQLLSLSSLEYIADQDDWQVINSYLLMKGWKYMNADSSKIVWAYNPSRDISFSNDDLDQWKANAWFSVYLNQFGVIVGCGYLLSGESGRDYYNNFFNSLKEKGFIKKIQYIKDGALFFVYENDEYEITLVQKLVNSSDYLSSPSQAFVIFITKK
jgi:hypothetical protein